MPSHVLTLIAADTGRSRIAETAGAIASQLNSEADWLASDRAADIFFDGDTANAEIIGKREVSDAAIDVVIQPWVSRRKKLLVADMESTIIQNEMLDEMAGLLGISDRVAEVTHRAMNGELDFAASLRARVALFKGGPESLLSEAATHIRFSPGAATLVSTMRRHGARTVMVSGGFDYFCRPVRDALGFDRVYANDIIVLNGCLTGAVREPILDGAAKREYLRQSAAEFGVAQAGVLAVGDGANDLPMLLAAGLGIAYHAKPHVRAQIADRIDHADLSALLYIQGYRAADLVG